MPILKRRKKIIFSFLLIGGFFVLPALAQANAVGDEVVFNLDSSYDVFGRGQATATLKFKSERAYFYVENEYWFDLMSSKRIELMDILRSAGDEFDQVIYPKERAVFGSEWSPGIDNDKRITILLTQLRSGAGGYINTYDEYPKSKVSSSNEREMIYLNGDNFFSPNKYAYLAHEFQHLITFYQKSILHGVEEEVWLNEARSEYAPTVCGYNDEYSGSYLASRVDTFLEFPSDSLTEWKKRVADYGVANLFFHYLVDRYGEGILTKMILNDQVGIASIDRALSEMGYEEDFSDVFVDWTIASYLNDCQTGEDDKYCYLNEHLKEQKIKVDYSASYSGFPNLIVSRSSSVKDWSAHWYRFRQGTAQETDRDTLKLECSGSLGRSDFIVPYIVFGNDGETTVSFVRMEDQTGVAYIPNFTSQNKSVVLIPINQYKKSGFHGNEPTALFSFTASSVEMSGPVASSLLPLSGSIKGDIEIVVKGSNLSQTEKIIFGGEEISNFEIAGNNQIKFIAPAHSEGEVDLLLKDRKGNEFILADAFTYSLGDSLYPEGSLLRAKNDYRVYIIKGNYKRWIQTAEIFNQYRHLRWEDVIEVGPSVLAQYQESWLVRADGDSKVYELNADGTKHWLNMTAEQFVLTGHLWEMIYLINSVERDSYLTGSDVRYEE